VSTEKATQPHRNSYLPKVAISTHVFTLAPVSIGLKLSLAGGLTYGLATFHLSLLSLPEWPVWRPSAESVSSSELAQIASGNNLDAANKKISPPVVKNNICYPHILLLAHMLLSPPSMEKSPSSTPHDDPSTTQTNTDYSSTETSSNTLPQPDPSPFPNSLSVSPGLSDPSSGTSPSGFVTKPGKSLNVIAVAIGVTGAVLLLAVCGVVIFYLRKKKQKKKVAPSAEFMHVAARWRPRAYRETNSPTSLAFIPNDAVASSSSLEPLRHPLHVSLYSPPAAA